MDSGKRVLRNGLSLGDCLEQWAQHICLMRNLPGSLPHEDQYEEEAEGMDPRAALEWLVRLADEGYPWAWTRLHSEFAALHKAVKPIPPAMRQWSDKEFSGLRTGPASLRDARRPPLEEYKMQVWMACWRLQAWFEVASQRQAAKMLAPEIHVSTEQVIDLAKEGKRVFFRAGRPVFPRTHWRDQSLIAD